MTKPKGKTIYIVFWSDEVESYTVCGAFSTRRAAKEYIKQHEDSESYYIEITELQ